MAGFGSFRVMPHRTTHLTGEPFCTYMLHIFKPFGFSFVVSISYHDVTEYSTLSHPEKRRTWVFYGQHIFRVKYTPIPRQAFPYLDIPASLNGYPWLRNGAAPLIILTIFTNSVAMASSTFSSYSSCLRSSTLPSPPLPISTTVQHNVAQQTKSSPPG